MTDNKEREIVAKLKELRAVLSAEKPSDEVLSESWNSCSRLVKELFCVRSDHFAFSEADVILDDVVPMFLKYWQELGIAPGLYRVYLKSAKLLHQLNQMQETGLFTKEIVLRKAEELNALSVEFDNINLNAPPLYVKQGLKLITAKFLKCGIAFLIIAALLKEFENELDAIAPALIPIHKRLVEIKTELASILSRKGLHSFSLVEVEDLQGQLLEIDSVRIDGKYISKDSMVLSGQAAVISMLESCFDDIHQLRASREIIAGENPLRPIYEDLITLKSKLEYYSKYKWSLKSEELIRIQQRLGEIDNLRVDGKFMYEDECPPGQAILHFILHKCYKMVYSLQTDDIVAESLSGVYSQLLTLEKCLEQLLTWDLKLDSIEVLPYQMKISLIDKQRVDGKFMDDSGNVPHGQAVLNELLAKCHENLRVLANHDQ